MSQIRQPHHVHVRLPRPRPYHLLPHCLLESLWIREKCGRESISSRTHSHHPILNWISAAGDSQLTMVHVSGMEPKGRGKKMEKQEFDGTKHIHMERYIRVFNIYLENRIQ